MQSLKAYKVTFLGPTNFKGSRIKITDTRTNKSVTLGKSYDYNYALDQAIDYLKEKGVNVVGSASGDNFDILLSADFSTGLGLV